MQLTLWTYEGPTHVGAMRIATAMRGLHYVLHAPQGDTYADLLFTMIERLDRRPPVTYTTFQARDLGSDTAELFQTAAREAYERFQPEAMIVGASCTAELIQDDPGGLARALDAADTRHPARVALVPAQGKLGRGRDVLPAGAQPRRAGQERRDVATLGQHPSALQRPGTDGARLSPSRRLARDHATDHVDGHRHQRHGTARCIARRPAPARRRRFQRRAVPGNRCHCGTLARAHVRPALDERGADRHQGHARIHRRSRRAGRDRRGHAAGSARSACRLVFTFGRLDLPDRQARLHFRRRNPRRRGGTRRPRRTGFRRRGPGNVQPRVRP